MHSRIINSLTIVIILSILLFYIFMLVHHLTLPLLGYTILIKSLMILGGTVITLLSVLAIIIVHIDYTNSK
jgi:hypothetical protein